MNKLLYLLLIFLLFSTTAGAEGSLNIEYNLSIPDNNKSVLSLEYKRITSPEFHVRGIYVTGWLAGADSYINNLIKLVERTIINSMVIDVKDEQGYLSYKSNVKFAYTIGANREKIKNIKALLKRLDEKGIYKIARIVVFKDPLLARKRPDLALPIWNTDENLVYCSSKWVDPSEKKVWEYNVKLAREAIELGFDEVQFDYIRYPALANSPFEAVIKDSATKSLIINSFAAFLKRELKDLKAPISVDVFGLTTAVDDDLGIGQNFADLSEIVNIISPMVYPSHYALGSYGIEIPDKEPYQIIYNSLLDAMEKLNNKQIKLRPWLQDFSLKHSYSYQDVIAQINAVKDLGIKEWLLWNPRSKYTERAIINPPG